MLSHSLGCELGGYATAGKCPGFSLLEQQDNWYLLRGTVLNSWTSSVMQLFVCMGTCVEHDLFVANIVPGSPESRVPFRYQIAVEP